MDYIYNGIMHGGKNTVIHNKMDEFHGYSNGGGNTRVHIYAV